VGEHFEDDEREIDDDEYDARRVQKLAQRARWMEGGRGCLWVDECMTLSTRTQGVDRASILRSGYCSSKLPDRLRRRKLRIRSCVLLHTFPEQGIDRIPSPCTVLMCRLRLSLRPNNLAHAV
jgi:hypothetical protein